MTAEFPHTHEFKDLSLGGVPFSASSTVFEDESMKVVIRAAEGRTRLELEYAADDEATEVAELLARNLHVVLLMMSGELLVDRFTSDLVMGLEHMLTVEDHGE